jgi:hypothetical protein
MKLAPLTVNHTGIDIASVDKHLKDFTKDVVVSVVREIRFENGTKANFLLDS